MPASRDRKERQIKLWERTEFGRRLIAARVLRSLEQEELAASYRQHGGKAYEIGNWERQRAGEGKPPEPNSAQWGALTKALGLSQEWFTAPLDSLLNPPPPDELPASRNSQERTR